VNLYESTNDVQARTSPEFAIRESANVGLATRTVFPAVRGKRYFVEVVASNIAGVSLPTASNKVAPWDEDDADNLAFEISLSQFISTRAGGLEDPNPPYPPIRTRCRPTGVRPKRSGTAATEFFEYFDGVFADACKRHDFGYQNFGRRLHIRQTQETKDAVDSQFLEDMANICTLSFPAGPDRQTCLTAGAMYYEAVAVIGPAIGRNGFIGHEAWSHPYDNANP